jgi:hypothetical protein
LTFRAEIVKDQLLSQYVHQPLALARVQPILPAAARLFSCLAVNVWLLWMPRLRAQEIQSGFLNYLQLLSLWLFSRQATVCVEAISFWVEYQTEQFQYHAALQRQPVSSWSWRCVPGHA